MIRWLAKFEPRRFSHCGFNTNAEHFPRLYSYERLTVAGNSCHALVIVVVWLTIAVLTNLRKR